jgi:hypothetical protein
MVRVGEIEIGNTELLLYCLNSHYKAWGCETMRPCPWARVCLKDNRISGRYPISTCICLWSGAWKNESSSRISDDDKRGNAWLYTLPIKRPVGTEIRLELRY